MIRNVFILENSKIPGIERERIKVENLLKRCGKVVAKSPEDVDLIITMGGDGTFLRGVHMISGKDTIIYGLKYGKVGFLTNNAEDVEKSVSNLLGSDLKVQERMRLNVSVMRGGRRVFSDFALNEALIFRKDIRIVGINVSAKEGPILNVRADGLIVSTPTGSTAHNLSAQGPVIEPRMECFLVLPLSPHTLSWRPVVISSEDELKVGVSHSAFLVTDGQREFVLEKEDVIVIKKDSKKIKIILDEDDFFRRLSSKFNWSL